jgi:hypothetical protein
VFRRETASSRTIFCDSSANCPGVVHPGMVEQAALAAEDGSVPCLVCGGTTTLTPGEKKAEVHAKLCTDETIHYPEMRKAGTITEDQFQAWKATLTRNELLGHYKRVPDIHIMASFTHDETALMTTDLPAFNALIQTRLRERAEIALMYQAPHRHQTSPTKISL